MMDDDRIRRLSQEVLEQIGGAAPPADLEQRVAALEAAVARLEAHAGTAPAPPATAVQVLVHPSLRALAVRSGGDRCVLEPDKPCTESGACRSLGH